MSEFLRYALAHKATLVFISGFVGTAFVSTFPDSRPKSLDDWWAWAKDFIHQVGNAKRPTQVRP